MKRVVLQAVNGVVRNGQFDLVRNSMAEVIRLVAPRLFFTGRVSKSTRRPASLPPDWSIHRSVLGLVGRLALRMFMRFVWAIVGFRQRPADMQTGRTQCAPAIKLCDFCWLANCAG